MILPFSTQLNGKPTHFVERIHKGIRDNYMLSPVDPSIHYPVNYNFQAKSFVPPKIHTIREDKKDHWKVGTNIDFFINCRQKNMFRFAPVLPVVSIQEIEVNYVPTGKNLDLQPIVFIDKKFFYHNLISNDTSKMFLLAKNDGFDSIPAFFDYFNKNFKGKIIHWTDFKY